MIKSITSIIYLIMSVIMGLTIGLILKSIWGSTILNVLGFIFIWLFLVLTLSCVFEKGGVR